MGRIAALPMYLAAGEAATVAFWDALAAHLRAAGIADVPQRLDQNRPAREIWADPALLFAQGCGWPLVTEFAGRLRVIATPVYAAPGCEGPMHRAYFIVAREAPFRTIEDLRGTRFAINTRDSNTGMNLPRHAIAPLARGRPFFAEVVELGSHGASLDAVVADRVDAAAIDCVTYAHHAQRRPDVVAATRIIGETAPAPALPFVTSLATDDATLTALRHALDEVVASGAFRANLFLEGIAPPSACDYRILLDYAEEARRLGYAELA
jgi:ABC-type phosphate/phosphonate transport system substrate-binding protein